MNILANVKSEIETAKTVNDENVDNIFEARHLSEFDQNIAINHMRKLDQKLAIDPNQPYVWSSIIFWWFRQPKIDQKYLDELSEKLVSIRHFHRSVMDFSVPSGLSEDKKAEFKRKCKQLLQDAKTLFDT